MKFSITEWRILYDKAHQLGILLKDSTPDYDGNPAKTALSRKARSSLEEEIDKILIKSGRYLDSCGMSCPSLVWKYIPQSRKKPKKADEYLENAIKI